MAQRAPARGRGEARGSRRTCAAAHAAPMSRRWMSAVSTEGISMALLPRETCQGMCVSRLGHAAGLDMAYNQRPMMTRVRPRPLTRRRTQIPRWRHAPSGRAWLVGSAASARGLGFRARSSRSGSSWGAWTAPWVHRARCPYCGVRSPRCSLAPAYIHFVGRSLSAAARFSPSLAWFCRVKSTRLANAYLLPTHSDGCYSLERGS